MEALKTTQLSKKYRGLRNASGGYAVKDLNITVNVGDVYGFLGPNGSGKTTTIRMLLGLVRPSGGNAEIFGASCITNRLEAASKCGAMIDVPAFYPYLTALDNLLFLGKIAGGVDRQRAMEVLETVGLKARATSKVKTFSHGMRQRLGFAYAILRRPKLLILDEPTNGLDPEGNWELLQAVRRLNREEGVTIMLSSHLLSEIEQICNRTSILRQGVLLYEGEVSKLTSDENVVEIATSDDAEASRILSAKGITMVSSSSDDGRICCETDDPAMVNDLLVRSGIRVSYIGRRKRTLREVFLRYMNS
ncbi:MAG: ABC transporter ATP-binding protein [Planctomycetota bacterium]